MESCSVLVESHSCYSRGRDKGTVTVNDSGQTPTAARVKPRENTDEGTGSDGVAGAAGRIAIFFSRMCMLQLSELLLMLCACVINDADRET